MSRAYRFVVLIAALTAPAVSNFAVAAYRHARNPVAGTFYAARLTTFGDIPLAIVSRDPRKNNEKSRAIWDREQEQLKLLSSKSWRVIAADAGHGVHHDRPEVVTAQSSLLVQYLEGDAAPPFGTTTVE